MAGHSKWSTIKRKKGAVDAKRGKIFTKIIREITVAAKIGGGDVDANPRLRLAVDKAKAANMPGDNIQRAIKKGTGELESVTYEECIYEGYGPGGAAVIADALTDNRNRTTPEVKKIFSKFGGNMGESGCVAWQFDKCGLIAVDKKQGSAEEVMELALEAGAEDFSVADDAYEITTSFTDFHEVCSHLEKKSVAVTNAEITMMPQNTIELTGNDAETMLKLMEALEDHDDVQNVYANFDIDESTLSEQAG